MMLKSLELKYEIAYNGRDAIDKVLKNRDISLVIMDCNMPIMDGWEATEILTEMMKRGEIQDIPIIACTAYCDEENIQKCFASGMKEILKKPAMKKDISDTLKKFNLI